MYTVECRSSSSPEWTRLAEGHEDDWKDAAHIAKWQVAPRFIVIGDRVVFWTDFGEPKISLDGCATTLGYGGVPWVFTPR